MDLMNKYPRLSDLESVARRKIPGFVFAYLDSGTGQDQARDRNRDVYRSIDLTPQFLRGRVTPDISTTLFGTQYDAPFGVAPIGLASMIWPGSEQILARTAAANQFPYALSTVAGDSIENVAAVANGMLWFQLYVPHDRTLCYDLLRRAEQAGVETLILTADVPSPSRRERMRIAGAPLGSRGNSSFTPRVIWQSMTHPEWALRTLANGGARFRNMEPYADDNGMMGITQFIGEQLNGSLDWDYLDDIRSRWNGRLLLKGILHSQDAHRAAKARVDGLILSNHGGRQLDAVPHPLHQVAAIRASVGSELPLIVDSGIRSGLDVVRAIAAGADFVMLGRAFMYAVAALGARGGDHAARILIEEICDVMAQLGLPSLRDVRDLDVKL